MVNSSASINASFRGHSSVTSSADGEEVTKFLIFTDGIRRGKGRATKFKKEKKRCAQFTSQEIVTSFTIA